MSEVLDRRVSFNAGEISPWLDPRIDMDKYRMACRTMQNMRGTIYGGAFRRPGLEYIGSAISGSSASRLVSFIVNSTTQYLVEFSNLALQIWSADSLAVVASGIVTPYLASELDQLQFAQQNDVLMIAHPAHPPMALSRYSSTAFSLQTLEQSWGPFLDENITATTLTTTSARYRDYFNNTLFDTVAVPMQWSSSGNSNNFAVGTIVAVGSRYFACAKPITSSESASMRANVIAPLTGSDWKTWWVETNLAIAGVTSPTVNAGELVNLTSSTSGLFTQDHVGTKWLVSQRRSDLVKKITLRTTGYETSDAIYTLGAWSILVRADTSGTGNWSVSLLVERSSDGITWESYLPVQSSIGSVQQLVTGNETDPVFLRVKQLSYTGVSAGGTAPTLPTNFIAELEVTNPNQAGVVKIVAVQSPSATRTGANLKVTLTTGGAISIAGDSAGSTYTSGAGYLAIPKFTLTGGTLASPGGRVAKIYLTISGGKVQWGVVDEGNYSAAPTITIDPPSDAVGMVITPLYSGDATTRWQAPVWNPTNGYPRAITIHDGRLWFGGSTAKPTTLWGSAVDDYGNFRTGAEDDRALIYRILADESSSIEWLVSQELLIIGTSSGEWVYGQKLGEDISKLRRNTSFGSASIQARMINDALVFIQRSKRKLREYAYAADKDGYNAVDLNMLAEHLGDASFKQLAIQRNPEAIVWIVTDRGDLLALTYERGQAVTGWSRHLTDGIFESVAVVLGSGEDDQVWVSVKRTVAGATVRYIERFQADTIRKLKDGHHATAVYLDSAKTVTPVSKVCSGLIHLQGKTVSILADGMVHRDLVVSSTGTVTLDAAASSAIIGLPYSSIIEPTYLETMDPNSLSKLGKKRLTRATLEVWKTIGGEISSDSGSTWREMQIRGEDSVLDVAATPFTGLVEEYVESNTERQVSVAIRQTQPIPLNVMSMNLRYRLEL